jgi:dTDP-4-amino-4,6-dideoxygalactose transaminase
MFSIAGDCGYGRLSIETPVRPIDSTADTPTASAEGSIGTSYHVPFNRATLTGAELQYITEAVQRMHLAGDGHFTRLCSEFLEGALSVPKALLTPSCTHALEMCALLLDLTPGDEVIVPSFSFVSTVNAFVLRGAKPVFADVRPDTLNLDERTLNGLITPRTKAIVIVHYAGVACELDEIMATAARHGVAVIEDNAHGLFGRYRGRPLGAFGQLATLSFHETKNLTCGEGGALLVNDRRFVERAEILRSKGTNRARFLRGQVDKYTWVDVGSSCLPSEISAAFLFAQLERWETIQQRRRQLWDRYAAELTGWASARGVRLPTVPDHCDHPSHLFYLLMPDLHARERLIAHLANHGVNAVFHYQPLHLSGMGLERGGVRGACPVTESVCDVLLRLPLYHSLTEQDQSHVIDAIQAF